MAVAVTSDNFDQLVSDGLVLVDVWSQRCSRCLALKPHVEQIEKETTALRVLMLEAPGARRLCMKLKVSGLPTFLLFEDRAESARISDPELDGKTLRAWLSAALYKGVKAGESSV